MFEYFKLTALTPFDLTQLMWLLTTHQFFPDTISVPALPLIPNSTFDYRQFLVLWSVDFDGMPIVRVRTKMLLSTFNTVIVPTIQWTTRYNLSSAPTVVGVSTNLDTPKFKTTQTNFKLYQYSTIPITALITEIAAVQYLDGTIVGNEFIDRSGNGYNVDIINNDITADMGFPYKSVAMIAQKAANFGLIPNPNYFWFTAGGTPNQIPVVSLYQNIDYANQIFTRHVAQVTNASGVELYEPRVMEIVTYPSPLTDDLSVANTFFGVPTEITTNVIWVDDINGNDTTGTGTKLLPWKTLTKANTGTSNKTIYVKTAAYSESASIFMLNGQTWIFIGYCTVTNSATPVMSTSSTTGSTIRGAIITPPAGGRAVYFISGNNNSVDRCKLLVNGAGSKNFQMLAGTGNSIRNSVLINSSDTPHIDVRAIGLDIIGCHFSGTQSGVSDALSFNTTPIVGTVNILYNKFVNTLVNLHSLFLFNVAGTYNIKYNYIKTTNGSYLQSCLAGASMTGNITYQYNHIEPTGMNSSIIIGISATNVINYNVSYNYFKVSNTNTLVNGLIFIFGQPSPIVTNNYIDNYTIYPAISVSAQAVRGAANISYNTILSRADGGSIVLGSDADNTYDNCYNGSLVMGNKCYGIWYFNPTTPTNLNHGIAIFNCIDTKVLYNYCNGTNHLVVLKASDRVTATPNTDCIVAYNIGINNDGSFFPKTMSGIKFYNNTTYADNPNIVYMGGGAYLLGSTGPATNNIFKNNIFIDKTPYNINRSIYRVDPATCLTGFASNNNVLYSKNNAIANVYNPGTNNYNFAQWKALGYDTNSINSDVIFNSINNEQFWTLTKIEGVANLGATFENGLDISTQYASGPTKLTMNIVTKKQGTVWQAGAYIQ